MPAADLLLSITQLAEAVAGLSGLIAVNRTAAPDRWHPRDIWPLFWMLGATIGALILALLPLRLKLSHRANEFRNWFIGRHCSLKSDE